jgi:hypothetical protein
VSWTRRRSHHTGLSAGLIASLLTHTDTHTRTHTRHRYEVAQANAAEMLDDDTCAFLSLPLDQLQCQKLAVRYYRHASK